jgi:hypothetical protein
MGVGIDEAGQDYLTSTVEGFAGRIAVEERIGRAYGDNRIILNGNGTIRKNSKGVIHAHNDPANQ